MLENKNNVKKESIEIPDIRTLQLLYTNDIQGEAEQMAYLATVVKQARASEPYTILVDSGNWAKGTLLSDRFKGMPMVEIMSAIGYDAVGIGEGEIAFGSKNLYALSSEAKFPLLCCNLVEAGTGLPPSFLQNKFTLLERGPFKVAIIGVAAPGKYPSTGLEVKDPFTLLPEVLNEISKLNPDIVILLSRLGFERDRALARAFPQLSVIVGGADRINLEKPHREGQTFILQAGEKAKFLGSLAIDMEATIRITSSD